MKNYKKFIVFFSVVVFSIFIFSNDVLALEINENNLLGRTEGISTYFEIKDSNYLNISVDSSEMINAIIESFSEIITLSIEPSTTVSSTQLTINNLSPLANYYLYQNDYHNLTEFMSDENGSYSFSQDLTNRHFLFIQTHKSTKFIKDNITGGDCIFIGNWDSITKTCFLTMDIYETIQIDNDGIILDGNNHTITGWNNGYGVYVYDKSNVVVKNLIVKNFSIGVFSLFSNNISIKNNLFEFNRSVGIQMNYSVNSVISGNILSGNYRGILMGDYNLNNSVLNNSVVGGTVGIIIFNAINEVLRNNIMSNNQANFQLWGYADNNFNHDIDTSNLVDGKPIYYVKNAIGQIYDSLTNAGAFFCINCDNVIIKDLNLSKNATGLLLYKTSNSKIENITSLDNFYYGIVLLYLQNNKIDNNNVFGNECGISLLQSSNNNEISNNNIYENQGNNEGRGVLIQYSNNNKIIGNNILNNRGKDYGGVIVGWSSFNQIYNNNFIGNTPHQANVSGTSVENIFYLSLPNGGNYWDNFDFVAEGCDDSNSDKICDVPYIFQDGRDNYPWTVQNGWTIPTASNISQLKSDSETVINENGITTESAVIFKADIFDLVSTDQVKLQIELKEYNQPFDGADILESDFVASGSEAIIQRYGLINGKYHWRARAIDDKGNVSDWQEFGEVGNVDFEVKLVPLYTQIISNYPSRVETESWFDLQYGAGNYSSCFDDELGYSSIRKCGCAITSMVMLGRYYGINAIDNSDVNPGNINTWLTNNSGYLSGGSLIWAKGVEYLGIDDNGIKKSKLVFDYYNTTDNNLIDSYINVAEPAIVFNDVFGHYFVVDGKIKTGPNTNNYTYTLKDSYWYNTQKLNQTADTLNYIQNYNNYFQKANLFSYSETSQQISASIYIYLASPAELLITDPLGRKLGKDPILNISYNEIPNGIYTYEESIATSEIPLNSASTHKTKVIYIKSGNIGNYDVQVIGTGMGSYTVSSLIYDNQGNSHTKVIVGNTQPNLITDYNLNFIPDSPINIDFKLADTTPPVISHTQISGRYLLNSAPVNFDFSAVDLESGILSISAKLDDFSIASGSLINLNQIGHHTIEITAQDIAGNVATETIVFDVVYNFSGFLSPIKIDGSGIYNLGRTLPIKFQLADANGNYISTATAQLFVAKISDGILGMDEIPLSTNNADTGNLFRYDEINNQYIYNLSTDSLSAGAWQLKTVLDDGKYYTVIISIR